VPRFKHVVTLDYKPTFRTSKVSSMFDVQVTDKLRKEWDVDLPLEEKPWQVGLIVGASGSGKSTLANRIWPDRVHSGFEWSASSLLDDFSKDLEVKEITEALSKVGFSSPPQWLLPYSALSTGQKFRVELARCLLEYKDTFVFDEFTSVVDRQVAQIGAFAFQKAVRKSNRQVVAVTCHYDVESWLEPDWVFDVSTNTFKWGGLRRPRLELEICRVHYSAWNLFKEHHYLTAEISKSAICFVGLLDGRPVVFDAWLPFVGRTRDGKNAMRGSRTVCLPDFQGLGLGNALFSTLASMWAGLGYRVFSGTAHPAEINKRMSSGHWRLKSQGRSAKEKPTTLMKMRFARSRAAGRLISTFEYTGPEMDRLEAQRLYAR
jgi:ABC-type lipoprotein export system ATPase subunit/GNAT superfamily N-acetyltransferase